MLWVLRSIIGTLLVVVIVAALRERLFVELVMGAAIGLFAILLCQPTRRVG